LGRATIPPSCSMVFAVASKFSTSIEHTNAFVPLCGGGVLAAAEAVHLSIRQFRCASRRRAVPESHQTSNQTPGNRSEPPVQDRRPGSRNRCDLFS
jgi:hypothetical protein